MKVMVTSVPLTLNIQRLIKMRNLLLNQIKKNTNPWVSTRVKYVTVVNF